MAQLDFSPAPHTPVTPQETTWTEPGTTRHLLRLEVVTDSRRLVGVVHHLTGVRPVDLLNSTDEPLCLADIEVTALEGRAEAPQRWPQAYIRKQAMALVIPHEVAPPATARRPLEYVEKKRWRVSVLLPCFMVSGCLHLSPAADPANASLFWNAGFVPLTDAEAAYLPDPSTTWKAAVIIVNSARAEAYCPPAGLAAE